MDDIVSILVSNQFILGSIAGVITGVAGSQFYEWVNSWRAYKAIEDLQGEWELFDKGKIDRESVTIIGPPRWPFGEHSHVLNVTGFHPAAGAGQQSHEGFLVMDRFCPWRGTRILRYSTAEDEQFRPDQISEQRIHVNRSRTKLYVTPLQEGAASGPPPYHKHELRKKPLPFDVWRHRGSWGTF
ncbi:MAG: hypothetical protein IT168_05970 [Bryobacterales bacterium]|nr:hypothetical protein [Bryobacterales bacterium]